MVETVGPVLCARLVREEPGARMHTNSNESLKCTWHSSRSSGKPLAGLPEPQSKLRQSTLLIPADRKLAKICVYAHSPLNSPLMESLKLGVIGLSASEQSLVATLIRLHRLDPAFIWTLTTAPPFDALLVDVGVAARSYVLKAGPRACVKRLSAPGSHANRGEMPRPIRSDLLVGWLNSIETGLLKEARHVAPATGGSGGSSVVSVAASAEASAIANAAGSLEVEAHRETPLPNDHTGFRLKRWPGVGVLAQDVRRVRMATLLSRRVMSLNELTVLSRLPATVCLTFLRELDMQGLLDTTEQSMHEPLVVHPHAHQAQPKPTANVRGGRAASMFHNIRSHFGIG